MHRIAKVMKSKQGARRVQPMPWVAPVGGWNTSVPLAKMPPTDAALLQNFFPEAGFLRARNGSVVWASGLGAPVNTVIPYMGTGNFMFGAAGTNIFDVTSTGPVGAAVVDSMTTDHWSFAQMTSPGGNFLQIANGFDPVQQFDGSAWSVPAWTGVSTSLLSVVQAYRERLYFIEKNTTSAWYGGTSSVSGALTQLDVGPNMESGGVLVAMGTWTTVVTAGPIEFIVFITSNGEAVIFQGSNPGDATNWGLLGRCKMSPPVGGDRCSYKIGGDLAIMTMDGVVSMQKSFMLDPSASDQAALTKNISPTWLKTVEVVAPNLTGWQFLTFPHRRMGIVNVPDPTGTYQFIMNTETKAWTKFVGLNALSWTVWVNDVYFGDPNGNVFRAEAGGSDNGAPIDCLAVGAWDFGDGVTWRQASTLSIIVNIATTASIFGGISTDLNVVVPQQAAVTGTGKSPAEWDVADWDVATWPGQQPLKLISAPTGNVGVVLGITVRALVSGSASDTSDTYIYGGSVLIEKGSFI